MKPFRLMALAALLAAALLSGCAANRAAIRGGDLLSIEDEKLLGSRISDEVEKKLKRVDDPELQGYVAGLGGRVLTGVRAVSYEYTFMVVRDDSVNIFVTPGGHLYLSTGLIKAVGAEGELAAVMAHEISHAVERHETGQILDKFGAVPVKQLLQSSGTTQVAPVAAFLLGSDGSPAYSPKMEEDADFLSVEIMFTAGFNPEGIISFLNRIREMQPARYPARFGRFLSAHPITAERIERVRMEINSLPRKSQWQGESLPRLRRMQERIR